MFFTQKRHFRGKSQSCRMFLRLLKGKLSKTQNINHQQLTFYIIISQKPKLMDSCPITPTVKQSARQKDSALKNKTISFIWWVCTSLYALKAGLCSVIMSLLYILNSIKWLYASVSIQMCSTTCWSCISF